MDSKLVRYFNKINLSNELMNSFEGAKLENVVVDNSDLSWTLYITLPKMIDLKLFDTICTLSESIKETRRVYYVFKHDGNLYLNDYVNYIFKKYQEKCPMLSSIKGEDIKISDNTINIEVSNNVELDKINSVKSKLIDFLRRMGYLGL